MSINENSELSKSYAVYTLQKKFASIFEGFLYHL